MTSQIVHGSAGPARIFQGTMFPELTSCGTYANGDTTADAGMITCEGCLAMRRRRSIKQRRNERRRTTRGYAYKAIG